MHRSRLRGRFAAGLLLAGACASLFGCAGGRSQSDPEVFSAAGSGNIQAAIDAFAARLAANDGSRSIRFDFVGPGVTNTNSFPGTQFSSEGVVLSTPGTGLRVSDNNFGDVNATYPVEIGPNSIPKNLAAVGSNIIDVSFQTPGVLGAPAGVRGFGAVFNDVDNAGSTTLQFFDHSGASLGTFAAPVSNRSHSFLGVFFQDHQISRVRITLGTAAMGAAVNDVSTAGGTQDIVAVDDFIYSEPQQID